MVQKTFGIYSEKEEHCRFFIEIGEQHMACWTLSVDYGAWNAFELFRLPETPDKKSYEALFAEVKLVSALIGRSYAATQVIWENPDAVCVPAKYFSEDLLDDYAETVIGATRGTVPRYAVLDDKEVLMKQGDCIVQRGTHHAWSNKSNEPCLIAFVLLSAHPIAS